VPGIARFRQPVMAEKDVRGDFQRVRIAVECDLSRWEIKRKVDCSIALPNAESSRGFGQVGYGQIAVMDKALPRLVGNRRGNRCQPFQTRSAAGKRQAEAATDRG
jgi:hypothetical protein